MSKTYSRAEVALWRADAFHASAQIATRYASHDAAKYIRALANQETKVEETLPSELEETRRYAVNYAANTFGLYSVVAGDTLSHIAQRFNLDWHKLAEINKLENPHLIFPDQIIKLR